MTNVLIKVLNTVAFFIQIFFTRVLSISFSEIAEQLLGGGLKDITILINLHYNLRVQFIGVR